MLCLDILYCNLGQRMRSHMCNIACADIGLDIGKRLRGDMWARSPTMAHVFMILIDEVIMPVHML